MFMEIRHYLTASGVDVFQSWLDQLKDVKARVAILRRIDRIAAGNFGDHKFLRDGVSEVECTWARGIACTAVRTERRSCFCYVAAPSERRQRTSLEPLNSGRTTDGDSDDAQDEASTV